MGKRTFKFLIKLPAVVDYEHAKIATPRIGHCRHFRLKQHRQVEKNHWKMIMVKVEKKDSCNGILLILIKRNSWLTSSKHVSRLRSHVKFWFQTSNNNQNLALKMATQLGSSHSYTASNNKVKQHVRRTKAERCLPLYIGDAQSVWHNIQIEPLRINVE